MPDRTSGRLETLALHLLGEAGFKKVEAAFKGFVRDQVSALQVSWFPSLSNADEAIFEGVKTMLYELFLKQGFTPTMATQVMREFEEYLAGLQKWQAVLFRLTVVTEQNAEERLRILARMFHDPSPAARDRIIENIIGDEPIMHRVGTHVLANYKEWALWFFEKGIKAGAKGLAKFVLKTAPHALKAAASATDQFVANKIAPHLEAVLTDPNTGLGPRLRNLGQAIKDRGGI